MTANGSGSRIRVFDESGDLIGTTYPKRAKGLVRSGRARWIARTPNASDPVSQPDSIVLYRNQSGAEAESAHNTPQNRIDLEDIMSEFNRNDNENREPTENEIRIQGMIAKFQTEMAKAREIAEKAAAEAQAAMEAARRQSHAAGEAFADEEEKAEKTVGESLRDLGSKLNEAAETAAAGIREAAAEISKNETVRETAAEVKSAGETILNDAKKKLTEAEERLNEARRAYEEAEKSAEQAENAAAETKETCDDLSKQVKENMKQIADEAGEALRTAWTELKKGWKELSAASADSFEWLKANTKDARETVKGAFREFSDNVRTMMSDLGDAGETDQTEDESCGSCESCESDSEPADEGTRINIEWAVPEDEAEEEAEDEEAEEAGTVYTQSELDRAQAEAMKTASDIRAEAAKSARKSIEDEIEAVKARVNGMLDTVKEKYDAGELDFEDYVKYTDKYSDFLHDRLAELRDELKNI